MVFLATGAGGRGSVVLTAARACDDGAAINNFMEAPTPELSLLFPHAPYSLSPIHSIPLAIPAPLILVPRSHFSVLPCSAVCTASLVSVLCTELLPLLSLTAPAFAPLLLSASSSQMCSPVSDLYSAPFCPQHSLVLFSSPGCAKTVLLLHS